MGGGGSMPGMPNGTLGGMVPGLQYLSKSAAGMPGPMGAPGMGGGMPGMDGGSSCPMGGG